MNNRPDRFISVQPLPGRRLQPGELQKAAATAGGTFDRRDLESMWKSPNWAGGSVERLAAMGQVSLSKACRLSPPDSNV